jgi:antiviral helicase SKI2
MIQYTAVERDMTAKNSTSMLRKPAGKEDFVRGRTGQYPFTPGGLEGISKETEGVSRYAINEKTRIGSFSSIPPGFSRGLRIKSDEEDFEIEANESEEDNAQEYVRSVHLNNREVNQPKMKTHTGYEEIDDLLPEEVAPGVKEDN